MTTRQARLDVIANTKKYQAELAKLPGFTDKKAANMAAAMSKHHMKMQLKAVSASKKAAKEAAGSWQSSMATAGGVISAQLIQDFARSVVGIGQETARLRNHITDMSGQTALASDTLAGLRTAAMLGGDDLDKLASGLKAYPKILQDFADGTGEGKAALERLGFEQKDAQKMLDDTDGSFKEVIKRLQEVPGAGQKAALYTKIFGESGGTLGQVLGDIPLEQYIAMTEQFGDSAGPGAAASAEQWQIAQTRLGFALEQSRGQLSDFLNLSGNLESFTFGAVVLKEIFAGLFGELIENVGHAGSAVSAFFAGDFAGAKAAAAEIQSQKAAWADIKAETYEVAKAFHTQTAALKGTADSAAEATRELAKTSAEEAKLRKETAAAAKALAKQQAEWKKAKAERAKAEAAEAAALDQKYAALEQLADMERQARSDTLSETQKINAAYVKEQAAIRKLAIEAGSAKSATEALAASEARRDRDLQVALEAQAEGYRDLAAELEEVQADLTSKLSDMWTDYVTKAVNGFMQAFDIADQLGQELLQRNYDRISKEVDAEKKTRGELRDEKLQAIEDIKNAESRYEEWQAQGRLKSIKGELQAQRKIVKARKKALKRAAKAQKAAALLSIGVNTAAAIMMAFAIFGPPPSPPGIAAAAAAGATGAVQAGLAATEPLPKYHAGSLSSGGRRLSMGGDERIGVFRDGELTLNQRASQKAGGDLVRDVNAEGSAVRQPLMVRFDLARRTLQTAFIDGVRNPGPMSDVIWNSGEDFGFVNPYGGG